MGLKNAIKYIILDITKNRYVSVQVKQNDRNIRTIIATITNNGKPYHIDSYIVPRIKCKKSDGTYIVNDCTILEDGNIKIQITNQMTVCDGIHDCELALFEVDPEDGTEKVLHTMSFYINVKQGVFSDDEISSTNEFKSFENALIKIDEMQQQIDSGYLVSIKDKGVPNGVASLDENGFIPSSQLPSFVDDVLDGKYDETNNQFLDLEGNVYTPESSKIYIDVDTRITYRWSGTAYVEIASSLALGETSSTAFAGDRGLALEQLIGEGYREITEEEIDDLCV